MSDQLQTITLVLANGRRLVYTGKPQIVTGDDIKIVDVLFTEPRDLPAGCTWDTVPLTQGPPDLFADLPKGLKTAEFAEAWHEWQEYRKEKKQKLTKRSAGMQLRSLAKCGSDVAVRTINRSIHNGWTGLFPPEDQPQFGGLAAFAAKEDEDHEP